MNQILSIPLNIFTDGGPLMMSLILIALVLALILIFIGFINLKKNPAKSKKMLTMAGYSGILGLVLGIFGSFIGLIFAFDTIERVGDVSPAILAGGIKIALLSTTFGCFVFIISRIGMLFLRGFQKE